MFSSAVIWNSLWVCQITTRSPSTHLQPLCSIPHFQRVFKVLFSKRFLVLQREERTAQSVSACHTTAMFAKFASKTTNSS